MPWNVKKSENGKTWEIYKPNTGEVVGRSASKKKAEASVRARYAGARSGGEKLFEPINMKEIELAAVAVIELNEMEESGWEVQTVIFNKDKYRKREDALKEIEKMNLKQGSSKETEDEDEGNWRFRQRPPEDFTEFRTKKINNNITLIHGKLKK